MTVCILPKHEFLQDAQPDIDKPAKKRNVIW